MAPVGSPGNPREGNKPEPIGNVFVLLFGTICALGVLYLLWRRANSLRSVVSHQLKTWTTQEGQIRLSEDDGPPATEFLADDEVVGRMDQGEPPTGVTGAIESSRAAQ